MRNKHSKEEILEAAFEVAKALGLAKLTFGKVAKRLSIPDRTIVYYFPNKAELISAVLDEISRRFQALLGAAFYEPASSPGLLVSRAWPVISSPDAAPLFRMFFDAVGVSMHNNNDVGEQVRQLMDAWANGLAELLPGDAKAKRSAAAATIAMVDGLLLVHLTLGPEASMRAVEYFVLDV